MMRLGVDHLIEQVASEVRTPSECPLATAVPVLESGWQLRTTCKRGEGICARVDRVSADLERWTAGAEALLESDSPEYKRMGRLAVTMANEPDKRTGKNCYASTGDLAIALDAHPGDEVVTTDRSFEVLGPAMGLVVHVVGVD